MNKDQKPDAQEIQAYIDELQNADWIDPAQKWWPKFVYHFTNLNNAITILENGRLLSRAKLEQTQQMATDNASPEVINQTGVQWKEYVRLYFRPRTPTQYINEGFRPNTQRELGAHCPFPIYFLFDSKGLLSRKNVYFSKGSLASFGTTPFSDAKQFKEIPFQLVYHDSWFPPELRSEIIYRRHAEVIIKDCLNLDFLKYVLCRSEAEYKTLLYLLSSGAKKNWGSKIGSSKKGNFYFRNWLFVEEADLNTNQIYFKFNIPKNKCDVFI